jgi:hypothetical protein
MWRADRLGPRFVPLPVMSSAAIDLMACAMSDVIPAKASLTVDLPTQVWLASTSTIGKRRDRSAPQFQAVAVEFAMAVDLARAEA